MNSIVFKDSAAKRAGSYSKDSITEGVIWKALLAFFFPILFGTFFQQLYNTVDAVVVGRYVGKEALAAVGGGAAVYVNLIVGFFVGLTSGAGVLISQFYGAKNDRDMTLCVHTSMALSIAGGLVMTVIGVAASSPVLIATRTPADTFDLSLLYLRIYFMGMVPMFVYNMGSSVLRAIGDSRTPLVILVAGCVTNIVLDLLLVIVFKLGVAGVAIATLICQTESAVITSVVLMRAKGSYALSWDKVEFTPHILAKILRLGFPAGIQSCLYTVSNLIIQTFINSFGTNDVAAWAAYGKIDAIFWMLMSALGISLTTFAGQNYGAGKFDRVRKSLWESLGFAVLITVLLTVAFCLWGRYFFLLFTNDAAVLSEGMKMMWFLMPFWGTFISIEMLSGAIRGCGVSFIPMMITVFGVCLLRIVWLFTAVPLCRTIIMVMASYPITWSVTSIAFWIYWLSGKWIKKPSGNDGTETYAVK